MVTSLRAQSTIDNKVSAVFWKSLGYSYVLFSWKYFAWESGFSHFSSRLPCLPDWLSQVTLSLVNETQPRAITYHQLTKRRWSKIRENYIYSILSISIRQDKIIIVEVNFRPFKMRPRYYCSITKSLVVALKRRRTAAAFPTPKAAVTRPLFVYRRQLTRS